MQNLGTVAYILVMIGALNWLLVGIGEFAGMNLNVVNLIVGSWPVVEAIVYVLVGLSAVYMLVAGRKSSASAPAAQPIM